MQTRFKSINRPLPEQFQFASFSFPKYCWRLPKASKAERLDRAHNPVCGEYQLRPQPNTPGHSFYLASDFMPGLRWDWADEFGNINHTGWYCDEYQNDKIRGMVFRLPHGRGFLAGWSMGKSLASFVDYDIHDTIKEAAQAADECARVTAEREREYQEAEERKKTEAEENRLAEMAEELA